MSRWENLCATLEGLERQSRPPDEILLVADHNRDLSHALTSLGVGRVLLHTGARGCAGARNHGWQAANGELVAFLDDDDRWGSKSYLSAVRAAIGGQRAATFASGDIVVVDDDMRVLETIPFAASTSPEAIRCDNKILVSGFAFSRALSGRLGPFHETLPIYWDWDWYLRLHAADVAFHDLGPQAVTITAHRRATSGEGQLRLRADNLALLGAKHGLGPLTLRNHESIARDEAAGR